MAIRILGHITAPESARLLATLTLASSFGESRDAARQLLVSARWPTTSK